MISLQESVQDLERQVVADAEDRGLLASTITGQITIVRISLQIVAESIQAGEQASLKLDFGHALADLAILAKLMGISLWDARQGLHQADLPELARFLQSQPMTWENRQLWLACLEGSLRHNGIAAPKHLGALVYCVEEGARIHTGATLERLLALAVGE